MSRDETNEVCMAKSATPQPEWVEPWGRLWKLYVSPELVEQMGEEWSGPVEFRCERLPDGVLELIFRKLNDVMSVEEHERLMEELVDRAHKTL